MFKDRQYYINKIKYYAGLALTALLFDAMMFLIIILAITR